MTEPLVITRLVPATPEQVWLSWTTEPGLATWWWHTWPDTRYRVNAWVGGEYRIEAADHGFGVRGTFEVVEAPSRLVFSWVWSGTNWPTGWRPKSRTTRCRSSSRPTPTALCCN